MARNVKVTVGMFLSDFGKLRVKWQIDGICT
jgi:hypothetical protein